MLLIDYGYSICTVRRLSDDVKMMSKAICPTAVINLYYNVGSLIGSIVLVLFTAGFVQIGSLEDWL